MARSHSTLDRPATLRNVGSAVIAIVQAERNRFEDAVTKTRGPVVDLVTHMKTLLKLIEQQQEYICQLESRIERLERQS